MDIVELKSILQSLAARFFAGATVTWAEQIQPQPMPPYVTLKTGRINRTAFSLSVGEDDRYYQADTTLEINLYTAGKEIKIDTGNEMVLTNCINTAVGDLTDFFLYLESEAIQDELSVNGVSLQTLTPPTDASQLINDVHFKYRAMAELTVSFPIKANGFYGVSDLNMVPNASGGATSDMVTGIPIIEDAETDSTES